MNPVPVPLLHSKFRCRNAESKDVPAMAKLIQDWAARGIMLPRSEKELLENLSDFSVLERRKQIVACGAIASYGPDLAELRSIVVRSSQQGEGLGRTLVENLIQKAISAGFPKIFVFTYVPGFFEKLGFHIVPSESLPQKAWKDCRFCPKRVGCDEIAMIRELQ